MKGMTLTKRSSTFVKYYFPCEEPEGGGSSFYKSKLFAECLINTADKLTRLSSESVGGLSGFWQSITDSVVFSNSSGILLWSFKAVDGVYAQRQTVPSTSKQEPVVCCCGLRSMSSPQPLWLMT